MPIKWTFEIL